MTTTEQRELDAWIDIEIFGVKKLTVEEMESVIKKQLEIQSDCGSFRIENSHFLGGMKGDGGYWCEQKFTRRTDNSFGAMEVLEKCVEKVGQITIYYESGEFCLSQPISDADWSPTLELAIALFAQKVFTK